ncbi:hypothetical protein HDU98_008383 [Podochytrium sp. JEL0797]|nr:hypothetical protein HDU98_008383 [Podochytrium sp. JEL0797]
MHEPPPSYGPSALVLTQSYLHTMQFSQPGVAAATFTATLETPKKSAATPPLFHETSPHISVVSSLDANAFLNALRPVKAAFASPVRAEIRTKRGPYLLEMPVGKLLVTTVCTFETKEGSYAWRRVGRMFDITALYSNMGSDNEPYKFALFFTPGSSIPRPMSPELRPLSPEIPELLRPPSPDPSTPESISFPVSPFLSPEPARPFSRDSRAHSSSSLLPLGQGRPLSRDSRALSSSSLLQLGQPSLFLSSDSTRNDSPMSNRTRISSSSSPSTSSTKSKIMSLFGWKNGEYQVASFETNMSQKHLHGHLKPVASDLNHWNDDQELTLIAMSALALIHGLKYRVLCHRMHVKPSDSGGSRA